VWHPELVSLRQQIGLPRHPAQIVMSNEGRLNLDARLFNVPGVPVFLLAAGQALEKFGNAFADRPWVTVIPLSDARPVDAFARLRNEYAVSRISVVGGRKTATALIDAGLVQDLYLTTAGREGGEPNTPFYTGRTPPRFDVIVRKHGIAAGSPIVFEHLAVDPHAPAV
jgi:riboflavin biosynthesis pyrimidine reductase